MQRAILLHRVSTHWSRLALGCLQQQVVAPTWRGIRYAMTPSPLQLQLRCLGSFNRTPRPKPSPLSTAADGSDSVPLSIEDQWTKLELYYQQNSLLSHDQCQRLLQQLEANPHSPSGVVTAAQVHFLMGACVPDLLPAQTSQQRLQLFQRLWQQLIKLETPTLAHYYTQLQVWLQNQLPLADHRALLAEIAVYNGPADASLYSSLLDVACASGNMRQATELLAEMREHNFALTERNFHALLLGHGRHGNLEGAESVLVSMRAAGITPNASTQAIRFVGYVENGENSKARDLLLQHQFTAPQLLEMLRGALNTRAGKVDTELVQQLVKELPRDFVSGSDVPLALRNLCIQLLHQERSQLMFQLVAALPAPDFNENQNVDGYAALILLECFRSRLPVEETLQFARGLNQRGQNTRALHLVTELALRRQPAAALKCFEALSEAGESLRPHYFWPLLLHQRRREGESGLIRLLADMQRLKVECDEDTLRQYVLPHLYQTLQQPLEALKQLDAVGIKPSKVMGDVIVQLIQQQEFALTLDLLKLYPTRLQLSNLLHPLAALAVHARATKRFELFAQLIQSLQQHSLQTQEDFVGALILQMCAPQTRLRQDLGSLQRFLHEMQRLQLQLSPAAAESLLNIARQSTQDTQLLETLVKTLQKMRHDQLSLPADAANHGGFIKHPRDMSLDELECHLIELEAKRLNARGVIRRLLQLSVREGRLERAQELLAKCEALNVQTSPGMMASIFDLHIKLKNIPQAEESLRRLQSSYPGFQIDEHKLIDFAALLVQNQQLESAKELLRQRAKQRKITGGDYVIKNVWQFLNSVAQFSVSQPGEKNLTYETFEFLRQLGYCQTHNALLGPVLREWLLRGDLEAAVNEFQRLSVKYKHTPLQFELLSLLVRLGNGDEEELKRFPGTTAAQAQQYLATVTATVSRVHGVSNMNSALLLALAESGTETQLRRLIINPEFRLNHELLIKNCEHLGQEGAVRTLLRLARGVRGVQRSIDEQRIYDMLLAQFAKTNNYEAALDLYERLEADDELKMSQEFVRNLVKMLQVNNVEIPSSIKLRAQIR